MNATPSLDQVDQLVGLRLMLQDALRRAHHAGPHHRATATVLLDATVERATFLSAVSLTLPVKTNEPLATLISRVKEKLGDRWKPSVLPGIRLQHLARNSAQHEGLAPDRSRLPGWASATETYVVGLIDAVFAVDLRRVVMSDAIVDPELRALLATAEAALAAGELEASAKASTEAFMNARDRWNRMHRSGQPDFWFPGRSGGTPAHTQSQIDELRSVISTAALAADPAEVAWFRAAAREPDMLDSDDVERMLSFAFGWVATFDLAQQSWVPDRRRRAAIAERLVRGGAGPARISGVISIGPHGEGRLRVIFRLRDVPGQDEYVEWAIALGALLHAGDSPRGLWEVQPNGTVTATFPEANGTAAVERLVGALAGTEAALVAERDKREAEQLAFQERTREYEAELAERPLPEWVNSVEIRGGLFTEPEREGLLVVIDESMANLVAPASDQDQNRDRIHDLIRRYDFVDEVYSRNGFGNIRISPIPTADQLAAMLGEADAAMQGWLAWQRDHDAERAAKLADATAQVTAAVQRASGDVA